MGYKEKSKILNIENYKKIYKKSIFENDVFWEEKANNFTWQKKWKKYN